MNSYINRIIIDILIFIAVLTLPWWLSVAILVASTIYFPFYLEVLFFGFLFDTLYGRSYVGILSALILLVVVMFVRTRIRT
jgi:hypothetical protein